MIPTIVSKLVYNLLTDYLQDLQPSYIGVVVIIHLPSTMDIPVGMFSFEIIESFTTHHLEIQGHAVKISGKAGGPPFVLAWYNIWNILHVMKVAGLLVAVLDNTFKVGPYDRYQWSDKGSL